MKVFFVTLAILIARTGSSQDLHNSAIVFNQNKAIVPISYRGGANPVIEVLVNGRGPYKFMFDTGASGDARLDLTLFKELNLAATDSIMAGDGSGKNNRWLPVTKLNSIEIGGYTIQNPRALVRSYNTRPDLEKIDGVIGLSFFEGVVVELNFATDEFTISKTKLDANAKGSIPFSFDRGVPVIRTKLNNKVIDIAFDLGNMGGLTFHENDIPKEIMIGEPKVVGQARTLSNTFDIKEVQLSVPVQIGTIMIEKPVVTMNAIIPHANAGVKFARQFNVSFDLSNKVMHLEKNVAKSIASSPNGSSRFSEYAGNYEGGRTIFLGNDGSLYIQRLQGSNLKMVEKKKDEFGLDKIDGAMLVFERDNTGVVTAIKTSRDSGANWEIAKRIKS